MQLCTVHGDVLDVVATRFDGYFRVERFTRAERFCTSLIQLISTVQHGRSGQWLFIGPSTKSVRPFQIDVRKDDIENKTLSGRAEKDDDGFIGFV